MQPQRLADVHALWNKQAGLDELDHVSGGDLSWLCHLRISQGLSLGVSATAGADARAVKRDRGVARSSRSKIATALAVMPCAAASLSASLPIS